MVVVSRRLVGHLNIRMISETHKDVRTLGLSGEESGNNTLHGKNAGIGLTTMCLAGLRGGRMRLLWGIRAFKIRPAYATSSCPCSNLRVLRQLPSTVVSCWPYSGMMLCFDWQVRTNPHSVGAETVLRSIDNPNMDTEEIHF